MIALNVRQPFAELIVRGKRRIELRNKATFKRERIFVFASFVPDQVRAFARLGMKPGDLPMGMLVGTVEIVDCIPSQVGFEWHLAGPERLDPPVKPTRPPLPVWFYPF